MKTGDIASTLQTFAELADADTAKDIALLAEYFSSGNDETIAQRIKKSGPANGHPAALKKTLETLRDGFDKAGAKKQASTIDAFLKVFSGDPVLSVDEFITALRTLPTKPARPAARTRAPAAAPDRILARELSDALQKDKFDPPAFNAVIARLGAPKDVNTPTLHAIANQFLGNSKRYKGRKAPIDDIVKRQQEDARDHALERALDRVAV